MARQFGSRLEWVVKLERDAVGSVGLTHNRVLAVDGAIVVGSRVPEHRAVVHHGVADAIDNVAVAQAARLRRYTQIPGIYELDKLGRLMVQNHGCVWRIRRGAPELRVLRFYVRLVNGEPASWISAVAVHATEDNIRRHMHCVRIGGLVTLKAANGLEIRLFQSLIYKIARGQRDRWFSRVNGHLRANPGSHPHFGSGWRQCRRVPIRDGQAA